MTVFPHHFHHLNHKDYNSTCSKLLSKFSGYCSYLSSSFPTTLLRIALPQPRLNAMPAIQAIIISITKLALSAQMPLQSIADYAHNTFFSTILASIVAISSWQHSAANVQTTFSILKIRYVAIVTLLPQKIPAFFAATTPSILLNQTALSAITSLIKLPATAPVLGFTSIVIFLDAIFAPMPIPFPARIAKDTSLSIQNALNARRES